MINLNEQKVGQDFGGKTVLDQMWNNLPLNCRVTEVLLHLVILLVHATDASTEGSLPRM